MKIRNGFVSNSSSSSFIVLFDKKPETKKEVKEILKIKDKKLINQIYERAQVCGGHVRTVEEIMDAELHEDWCNRKSITRKLTQSEADSYNRELLNEYESVKEYEEATQKEKRKIIKKHLLSYIFNKDYRHSINYMFRKQESPKLWKAGDTTTEEVPWLNWFDHESFKMDAFPKAISKNIVKAIDSYFEVPEHPYKVAVNLGDQHYTLNEPTADLSRFIFYTSEEKHFALSKEEAPEIIGETIDKRREHREKEINKYSENN